MRGSIYSWRQVWQVCRIKGACNTGIKAEAKATTEHAQHDKLHKTLSAQVNNNSKYV